MTSDRQQRQMAEYERLCDAVRSGEMTLNDARMELGLTPPQNRPSALGERQEIRGEVDITVHPGAWKGRR